MSQIAGIFGNALRLFVRGKLFREPRAVAQQWAIGCLATAGLLLSLAFSGLPHWLAIGIAAFAGGALQPWLFRNLKFN